MQAEGRLVDAGGERRTLVRYRAELPIGSLPEWAAGLPGAHEFPDAADFLAAKEPPAGLEAPFAGLRVSSTQRLGGPDDGRGTVTLSHGRLVSGRYYVQAGLQQLPEGTEGDEKDRPMDLRRRVVMLGSQLHGGLVGRCWLAAENRASDPGSERRKLGFALWGRLNQQDELEASVWHDSERWSGADRYRTSVSLLFVRRVSDENKLHVKVGYSWGAGVGDQPGRDCRVSLGYEKPI